MKKIIFGIFSVLLAQAALAGNDVEVKLKGTFNFQAAVRNQKNLGSDNYLTDNQKNLLFTQNLISESYYQILQIMV